jgi:hypothetical protein
VQEEIVLLMPSERGRTLARVVVFLGGFSCRVRRMCLNWGQVKKVRGVN